MQEIALILIMSMAFTMGS